MFKADLPCTPQPLEMWGKALQIRGRHGFQAWERHNTLISELNQYTHRKETAWQPEMMNELHVLLYCNWRGVGVLCKCQPP